MPGTKSDKDKIAAGSRKGNRHFVCLFPFLLPVKRTAGVMSTGFSPSDFELRGLCLGRVEVLAAGGGTDRNRCGEPRFLPNASETEIYPAPY